MYPHLGKNVPAKIPARKLGFHEISLDVKNNKTPSFPGFYMIVGILLDALEQVNGGGRGIRTPVGLSPKAVFKTACFNRSHIPPQGSCALLRG
jgi:hypothetical protein